MGVCFVVKKVENVFFVKSGPFLNANNINIAVHIGKCHLWGKSMQCAHFAEICKKIGN